MSELRIKRVYDPPSAEDGYRVLVDRLWPRGVSRDRAAVDEWVKQVAPSPQLRTWWNHDPARLADFTHRYRQELAHNPAVTTLENIRHEHARVTLLYAAKDPRVNHAAVLQAHLLARDLGDRRTPDPGRHPAPPAGGDPVCWLALTCPDCGAITEGPEPTCWRCGAPRHPEQP